MTTPASIKGHPLHTILVAVPIGLWVFALVADLAASSAGSVEWMTVAFYCIVGGVVGALLAAVPGLIDLVALPAGVARTIGIRHMVLNLAAVGVFAVNGWVRWSALDHAGPWWLTAAGIVLIGFSGWLGGEMVYRYRVGVADGTTTTSAAPSRGVASTEAHPARTRP